MIKAAGGPADIPSGRSAATSLLDCFDLEDHLILVMERPRNCKTLLDYRRDKEDHLAEDEAKVIMEQMIDAAIDMHSKGVFHRDIKLTNILVEVDPPGSEVPRVRVIDFGCSCQEELEPYDRFSGTLCIAPPEWFTEGQYMARPTTVWHLGVLLYNLLDHPGSFKTSTYIAKKMTLNSTLSTRCKDFLRQCLTPYPHDRITLEELKHHPWIRE
ncbi:serine/threonine-protein kinase pim-2-like [Mugil cephalus]|uniref:serine/threonine-protein kinase pim-2-like n=1 Tax=Mugil cephalus TaxID=48193 RepID=UPI001FB853EF|nr:serine/threonine-protein kinase pim-2-like [Mugil cephalus]